jgi:hypothetical protein
MKYLSAIEEIEGKLNSLAYARPGAGKTTFGLQHPNPVIVDPSERGYMTVLERGFDVPVLHMESLDDIESIVYDTEREIALLKENKPKWKDYEPKSFIFENANLIQEDLLGKPSKIDPKTKKVIRPATGFMSLPNARDNRWTPGPKDFNVLGRTTKDIFRGIRNMTYHTLITVHAGLSETDDSPKGIDVPASQKRFGGYPDMYGQLKYKGGGLCDFYFYLDRDKQGRTLKYTAYTMPHGKFEGRSKIAKKLPPSIDWTDKSLFDIVLGKLNEAIKEAEEKQT